MKKTISLRIDVKKIDKNRLYEGKKGTYLDAVLMFDDQDDKYGNNGMIVQSVSKEEREKGVKGNILGNAKDLTKSDFQKNNEAPSNNNNDLPF